MPCANHEFCQRGVIRWTESAYESHAQLQVVSRVNNRSHSHESRQPTDEIQPSPGYSPQPVARHSSGHTAALSHAVSIQSTSRVVDHEAGSGTQDTGNALANEADPVNSTGTKNNIATVNTTKSNGNTIEELIEQNLLSPILEHVKEIKNLTMNMNERGREKKYDSSEIEATAWRKVHAHLKKKDDDLMTEYEDDIGTLLTFAGLFSAVLTAFVIEAYKRLEEDNTETSALILRRISLQLEGSSEDLIPLPAPGKNASEAIIAVNFLWFLSLLLSLFAALFGILAKQWIHVYNKWSEDSPTEKTLFLRSFRRTGFDNWHVPGIIATLPVLLQAALFLFLIGLSIYLWDLNESVAAALSAISIAMVIMALVTIILPVFYQSCPYRTPLGYFLVYLKFDRIWNKSSLKISSWKDWDAYRVIKFQEIIQQASKNGEWIIEYLTTILDLRRPLIVDGHFDPSPIVHVMNEFQPATLKNAVISFFSDRLASILLDPESNDDLTGGIYAENWANLLLELDTIYPGMLISSIEGRFQETKKFIPLEGTVAIARNLQLLGSHATEWQYNSMKRNLDFCLRFTNDTAESLLRHMGRNSIEHDLLPLCESLQKPLRFWTGHGRNALIDEKILSTGNDYLDQLSKLQSIEPVLSVTSKERHSSPILSMKFSHDQRLVVSGSEDGTVRIWNTWNLRENIRDLSLRKFADLSSGDMMGAVNAVAFLPDPSFVVFGSRRGIISLWEFDKDPKPRELYYHGQDISVIATAKSDSGASIIVSGSHDTTVKIWESSSQELRTIKHKAPVSAVVFSPNSKRIASRSTDGRIIVSTVAAGTAAVKSLVIKGEDHSESAAIAFSPDGKALVLGSLDGRQSTIHIYSTETGKHIWGNVDGIASGTHYSPKSALRPQVHLAFTLLKQGSPYAVLRGDNGESHTMRLVGNMFDVLSQMSNASEIEPVFSVGPQPHRLTARLGPLSTKHTVFLSTAEDRPLWRTLVTSGYYAAFGHENGRITIINSESFLKKIEVDSVAPRNSNDTERPDKKTRWKTLAAKLNVINAFKKKHRPPSAMAILEEGDMPRGSELANIVRQANAILPGTVASRSSNLRGSIETEHKEERPITHKAHGRKNERTAEGPHNEITDEEIARTTDGKT